MSTIAKLLKKSSASFTTAPFQIARVPEPFRAAAVLLTPLLGERNGFYAFASALHIYGMDTLDETDILAWNGPKGWREELGELADGYFSFGEDLFGGQFCVSAEGFHHFNVESGEVSDMGEDAESWAAELGSDWDYWTGCTLGVEWQEANGALPRSHRLFPRMPFVLGGDFEPENLWCGETDANIGFYAYIGRRVHALEDGTAIRLDLPNGKTLNGTVGR